MKKILTAFIFILLSLNVLGQNPNLGTAGAQFLEIPAGAKAAALGGAYIGLSDDVSSVFWNPAGLSKLNRNAAEFSYMRWFDQFDYNSLAAAFKLEGIGMIGASLIIFSMDELEITTEFEPNGTGRFYDAQDIAFGLTFSRNLTDRFSTGVTVKYISQRIWNESATGIAFDIGTQYRLDFQNLTIAMRMGNFGPDLSFEGEDLEIIHDIDEKLPQNRLTSARLITETYPLPLTFQVGIGFDIYDSEFLSVRSGLDAVHPNDNSERILFGTEFGFYDRLFLRGGYKYNYDDEDFTFGAGANIPFASSLIFFDYAYSMYDILPGVHRVSVGMEF